LLTFTSALAAIVTCGNFRQQPCPALGALSLGSAQRLNRRAILRIIPLGQLPRFAQPGKMLASFSLHVLERLQIPSNGTSLYIRGIFSRAMGCSHAVSRGRVYSRRTTQGNTCQSHASHHHPLAGRPTATRT